MKISKPIFLCVAATVLMVVYAVPVSAMTGVIAGTAFQDLNRNRVQDAGEQVLGNWNIDLIDSTGSVVQTATTNASGDYQFTNLNDGAYVVRQNLRSGWQQTAPSFQTTFTAGTISDSNWGYTADPANPTKVLPADWGSIAPDANGNFQSPIDLPSASATDLSQVLETHYTPTVTHEVENNGHTIEVVYDASADNRIEIGDEEFELEQFHFHAPSEHTIDGVNADMELHLVHQHDDGGLAVLGVLLEAVAGPDNPFFATFFDDLPSLQNDGDHVNEATPIDAGDLLPAVMTGFFYEGSLTTPPNSEQVNWFVFDTPVQISLNQLAAYQAVGDLNDFNPGNRPLQPLNGRQLNELNHEITVSNGAAVNGVNFGATFVPEPATLATAFVGLASLCGILRRRNLTRSE